MTGNTLSAPYWLLTSFTDICFLSNFTGCWVFLAKHELSSVQFLWEVQLVKHRFLHFRSKLHHSQCSGWEQAYHFLQRRVLWTMRLLQGRGYAETLFSGFPSWSLNYSVCHTSGKKIASLLVLWYGNEAVSFCSGVVSNYVHVLYVYSELLRPDLSIQNLQHFLFTWPPQVRIQDFGKEGTKRYFADVAQWSRIGGKNLGRGMGIDPHPNQTTRTKQYINEHIHF